MKDTLMQKVTSLALDLTKSSQAPTDTGMGRDTRPIVSSALQAGVPMTDCSHASAELAARGVEALPIPTEGVRRVRRSAATLGLAISMSATGMLFAQHHTAVAANSLVLEAPLANLPAPLPPESPPSQAKIASHAASSSQLEPLALKHEVQPGESLWQLAQDYQVPPEAIATTNKISPRADLVAGQTLKIPSETGDLSLSVAKTTPSSAVISDSLNSSLDHLRETRKRLKESLVELKTEKANLQTNATAQATSVADVSQSLNSGQKTQSLTVLSSGAGVVEIPVIAPPESQATAALSVTEQPVPLAVPLPSVPEAYISSENSPQPIPLPAPVSRIAPLPATKGENDTEADAEAPVPVAKLPSVTPSRVQQPTVSSFNQPIPIAVPSPETAAISSPQTEVSSREFTQPTTIPTTPQQVYQVKPGDTLNSIARRYGLSVSQLIQSNKIHNPNLIKVHQTLVIPKRTPNKLQPQSGALTPLPPPNTQIATTATQLPLSATVPTAREIPAETAPVAYQEKLKADIANLQQEYSDRSDVSLAVEIASQQTSQAPVVGEVLNPEWASEDAMLERTSLGRGSLAPQSSAPSNISASVDARGTNRSTPATSQTQLAQLSRRVKPVSNEPPTSQSQLVGAAPASPEQYNGDLQIPVGAMVGPELPPLSVPDDYLPDAPLHFTGHIWPTKGVVTSGYGRRWGRMHRGIDIAAPIGTPVMASAPGEVVSAGWNSGGYGNLVKVRHPDGSLTLYAHNSRILVRRGQTVEQGQQIAQMGSTGYSTGPHLHFEIHPGGKGAVNPMAFLPQSRS